MDHREFLLDCKKHHGTEIPSLYAVLCVICLKLFTELDTFILVQYLKTPKICYLFLKKYFMETNVILYFEINIFQRKIITFLVGCKN